MPDETNLNDSLQQNYNDMKRAGNVAKNAYNVHKNLKNRKNKKNEDKKNKNNDKDKQKNKDKEKNSNNKKDDKKNSEGSNKKNKKKSSGKKNVAEMAKGMVNPKAMALKAGKKLAQQAVNDPSSAIAIILFILLLPVIILFLAIVLVVLVVCMPLIIMNMILKLEPDKAKEDFEMIQGQSYDEDALVDDDEWVNMTPEKQYKYVSKEIQNIVYEAYSNEKTKIIKEIQGYVNQINGSSSSTNSSPRTNEEIQSTTGKEVWQDATPLVSPISTNYIKTWMDYRKVTSTTSAQYRILRELCKVGDDGLLRYDNKYIAIATGSKLGPVGTKYKITFENGQTHYFIKGDAKADKDTATGVPGLAHGSDGSVIEFIIDDPKAMATYGVGSGGSGSFNTVPKFQGKIISIELDTAVSFTERPNNTTITMNDESVQLGKYDIYDYARTLSAIEHNDVTNNQIKASVVTATTSYAVTRLNIIPDTQQGMIQDVRDSINLSDIKNKLFYHIIGDVKSTTETITVYEDEKTTKYVCPECESKFNSLFIKCPDCKKLVLPERKEITIKVSKSVKRKVFWHEPIIKVKSKKVWQNAFALSSEVVYIQKAMLLKHAGFSADEIAHKLDASLSSTDPALKDYNNKYEKNGKDTERNDLYSGSTNLNDSISLTDRAKFMYDILGNKYDIFGNNDNQDGLAWDLISDCYYYSMRGYYSCKVWYLPAHDSVIGWFFRIFSPDATDCDALVEEFDTGCTHQIYDPDQNNDTKGHPDVHSDDVGNEGHKPAVNFFSQPRIKYIRAHAEGEKGKAGYDPGYETKEANEEKLKQGEYEIEPKTLKDKFEEIKEVVENALDVKDGDGNNSSNGPIGDFGGQTGELGAPANFSSPCYTDSRVNPLATYDLMGQCTWYAWGRCYEIYGFAWPNGRGNGKDCARNLANAYPDKFNLSSTPSKGAVISFTSDNPWGHVAFVEAYDGKHITVSEGNVGGSGDHGYGGNIVTSSQATRVHTYTMAEWNARCSGYRYVEYAVPTKELFDQTFGIGS